MDTSDFALSDLQPASWHPIGQGFELHYHVERASGRIRITLTQNGTRLSSGEFDLQHTQGAFNVSTNSLRVHVEIDVQVLLGEVTAKGSIEQFDPQTGQWVRVVSFDGTVLCRFSPAVGQVGGSAVAHAPSVQSQEFGNSVPDGPAVTRIFVDDRMRLITNVGRMVKKAIWADHGDLAINIVACAGPRDSAGLGQYANPNSIWFNVFLGYYQIDAPKKQWSRPFGYRAAEGVASQVDFDDLLRLGKSDWNFFSNWLYGTPLKFVLPYIGIDTPSLKASQSSACQIGSSLWHPVSMTHWEVVTGYESNAPGAAQLVNNSILSPSWRAAFGLPNPQANWPVSFVGKRMWTQSRMAYYEDDDAYHTLIFGGSGPGDGDPDLAQRFLQVQLAAVEDVIVTNYPTLGFRPKT